MTPNVKQPLGKSLVAMASDTYRSEPSQSQDAAMILRLQDFNLMAASDGMGSFAHAGEAARFCMETLKERLASQVASNQVRLHPKTVFAGLCAALRSYAAARQAEQRAADEKLPDSRLGAEEESLENTYGTTLLVGGESEHESGVLLCRERHDRAASRLLLGATRTYRPSLVLPELAGAALALGERAGGALPVPESPAPRRWSRPPPCR